MQSLQAAVRQWTEALGVEHVLTDEAALARYRGNVSALERAVPAVLRPATTDEVQRVVRIAAEHGAPLYPVSRGRNWGMGSRLPVRDGATIVDLSRMNRIRAIDAEHHYAVVEPGVTQGQLHAELLERALPLFFNVTGSGLDTSLIGNALERGVGYFSSRAEALSGLEVVLGTGEILNTGYGHFEGSGVTHLYKYGLGPYMDGLFAQSNYGIVTAAGMELLPRSEAHMAMVAKIDDEAKFAGFVQILADLRKAGILRTAVHIGNRSRTVSTLAPLIEERLARDPAMAGRDRRAEAEARIRAEGFGPWSAVGGLMGTREELRAARRRIAAALRGVAKVTFIDDRKIAVAKRIVRALAFLAPLRAKGIMLDVIEPLYGLSKGVPTDEPLKSTYWLAGDAIPEGELDPDASRSGFLYCLPMVPMSGRDAEAAVSLTRTVYGRRNFEAYITLNMVNTKVLEGVINLAFDRTDPQRVKDAHACTEELQQRFLDCGYTPYRLSIQSMETVVSDRDPFWRVARDLKAVFDPKHIIAPGRYNLV